MPTSFLSWKRDLDELRAKAIAQTYENPTPSAAARKIVESAGGKLTDAWMATVRDKARSGLDTGLIPPPGCTVYGWRLLLSRTRFSDGRYAWHFSASVSPKTQGPSEQDWKMLGRIAAHLGAPRDPLIVPDDPNDAHHWQWFDAAATT